jgi:glyoxalase family protein
MTSLVQGVHHITLCPGGAQQDVDFFTQVLGQRLVKQTVLMELMRYIRQENERRTS